MGLGLRRNEPDRERDQQHVGNGHGHHDDHRRDEDRRVHARRSEPVPYGRRDPVRGDRARQAERWQRRAMADPGSAPGPPDGRFPLRRGESGQQEKNCVLTPDLGAQVQPGRQV